MLTFRNITQRTTAIRNVVRPGLGLLLFALGLSWTSHAPLAYGQAEVLDLQSIVPLTALETPTDDLLRLTTTYADALRDQKIQQLNLQTVHKLRPNAVVTNLEVQIAQLNLEAAQNKLTLVREIVQKQLAAAERKLEIIKTLESIGDAQDGGQVATRHLGYVRATDEATVRILKLILEMK